MQHIWQITSNHHHHPSLTMLCNFKPTGRVIDGRHQMRCSACGSTVGFAGSNPARCRRVCQPRKIHPNNQPTTPWQLVKRYVRAVALWYWHGCPARSKKQIARIYDNICTPCEQFHDGGCMACGCRVNRSEAGLRNKLAQKTQHCPHGLW